MHRDFLIALFTGRIYVTFESLEDFNDKARQAVANLKTHLTSE